MNGAACDVAFVTTRWSRGTVTFIEFAYTRARTNYAPSQEFFIIVPAMSAL